MTNRHKFSSCRNMQLFVTRSAQHVCCETSEDKNQKLQATTGWPQCGTLAIEVPTGSRQKCIHKGTAHCFFFDCEAGEKNRLFRRLRKQIYPLAIMLSDPSVLWNLITRNIFNIVISWICAMIRLLIRMTGISVRS